MHDKTDAMAKGNVTSLARALGLAGLIPQILLTAVVVGGGPELRLFAATLACAYSALILSFLGGAWWGLAVRSEHPVSAWLWMAAVAPSLIAFAAIVALAISQLPAPTLLMIGGSLIFALAVDTRFAANGLCPSGWLGLRVPLSIGLGGLTMVIAIFA